MAAKTQTIVVRTPSAGAASRARLTRAAGQVARRGLVGAARAAMTEKHTITALGTAAMLGYVEKERIQVPHINALGVDGTVGAALWVLGRYTKNPMLQHAATGALCCAIKGAVVGNSAVRSASQSVAQSVQQQTPTPIIGAGVMGGAF